MSRSTASPRPRAGVLRAWIGWLLLAAGGILAAMLLQPDTAGAVAVPDEPPIDDDLQELDIPPDQLVARGAEIYQQSCAQCHGAEGGGSAIAPSLLEVSSTYIDLVLRTNRMPPGDLSPDTDGDTKGDLDLSRTDRLAVVAFTEAEFGLEGEIPEVPEGDPAQGLLVWGTHCAACHGAAGQGGVAGRGAFTPRVAGLNPITIAEAVRIGPFEMPRFSQGVVSAQEIGHVAAFMEFVADEPGTPVGLTETNPVYLAALAGVLALVVLLSCLWLAGRPVDVRGKGTHEGGGAGEAPVEATRAGGASAQAPAPPRQEDADG